MLKDEFTVQTMNSEQPNPYPLISVIVPVYNTEKYLAQCVNSILAQTYSNIEIILVDDGSQDSSPAICDDFAGKDARVRVIHNENGGVSAARNTGLDTARGEIVTFVDSDDYISPDMYMKLYGLMRDNDADIAMCSYMRVDASGNLCGDSQSSGNTEIITGDEALYRLVMPGFFGEYVDLWNKLYKAKLFGNVRFPQGKRHEDGAKIHWLFGGSRKLAITQERLYFYRLHGESVTYKVDHGKISASTYIKFLSEMEDAFRDREDYLRSRGMNDLAEFAHLRSSAYAVMSLMLQRLNYIQYRKEIRKITGYTPPRLIVKLLASKHSQLKKRGVKLFLLWLRSFFLPFVR